MASIIFVASGTHGIGFLGSAAAFAACAYAWERTAQKRAWLTLAIIQFVLLLDLVFNWRWELHDRAVAFALSDNVYDERRWPQKIILALIFVTMIVLALRLWKHFQRRAGLTIAVVATMLSVALRIAELISWHKADAILHYQIAGDAMVVNYLWFVLGFAAVAGVWIAIRYPAAGWR